MSSTGNDGGPRPDRGVRLTRRGRTVVAVLVLALVSALTLAVFWLTTRHASAAPTAGDAGASPRTAVVPAGGTLWEIAASADPGADLRVTVNRIMDRNGLSTPVVQPGERLVLPPRR